MKTKSNLVLRLMLSVPVIFMLFIANHVMADRLADCPPGYANNGATCGRGTDDISAPSRAADCPPGYTNIGGACGRGTDDISAPSRPATCPRGYTNIGGSCGRGTDDISAPSRAADCPKGYTNFGEIGCVRPAKRYTKKCTVPLVVKHKCKKGYRDDGCICTRPEKRISKHKMKCPKGYFINKTLGRCYKKCPAGYTNTGETCHRAVSVKTDVPMTCPRGYFLNKTLARCHKKCPAGYTNTGETCHRAVSVKTDVPLKCPRGYFLNKTLARCYKKCPAGYKNMGETCHRTISTLGMEKMRCRGGETQIGARCYSAKVASCPDINMRCPTGETFKRGMRWDASTLRCKPAHDFRTTVMQKCEKPFPASKHELEWWYKKADQKKACNFLRQAMSGDKKIHIVNEACIVHDMCYRTASSKKDCDRWFYRNIDSFCKNYGALDVVMRPYCEALYGFAKVGMVTPQAFNAYDSGQRSYNKHKNIYLQKKGKRAAIDSISHDLETIRRSTPRLDHNNPSHQSTNLSTPHSAENSLQRQHQYQDQHQTQEQSRYPEQLQPGGQAIAQALPAGHHIGSPITDDLVKYNLFVNATFDVLDVKTNQTYHVYTDHYQEQKYPATKNDGGLLTLVSAQGRKHGRWRINFAYCMHLDGGPEECESIVPQGNGVYYAYKYNMRSSQLGEHIKTYSNFVKGDVLQRY